MLKTNFFRENVRRGAVRERSEKKKKNVVVGGEKSESVRYKESRRDRRTAPWRPVCTRRGAGTQRIGAGGHSTCVPVDGEDAASCNKPDTAQMYTRPRVWRCGTAAVYKEIIPKIRAAPRGMRGFSH